jgi:hypothetical protein
MEKVNKIFFSVAIFGIVLLTGCETDRIVFEGPDYVRFSETADSRKESFSKVIQIPVHLAGPARDEDVTVQYTIKGNARPGIDYVILGEEGHVTIEAGEHFGYIDLQLINNSNNIIRSQDIIFTLLSSNSDLRIGQGDSQIGKQFTFTIFDDCILGGNYKGRISAFSIPTEGITITSEDCETYRLSNWNVGIFNTPFEMDLTFTDNADNTLTIPSQEEDVLPEELATIKGIGTVDPVTRVITMTIILVDFEGAPEITFTLLPD